MIATPSVMIHRNWSSRARSSASNWLPALLTVTVAIDGWLTVGPLAQSALIAVAVLKRLIGKSMRRATEQSALGNGAGIDFSDSK